MQQQIIIRKQKYIMGTYYAIKAFCTYTTMLFFRHIEVINPQNVPSQGPTIVYGNHNNQFVDGMLLVSSLKRKINFIAAAISVRRLIVGKLIKATEAIPVQRAQDLAYKGQGKIIKIQNGIVYGQKTKFQSIIPQSILKIGKQEIKMDKVINNEQFQTTTKNVTPIQKSLDFKIIPKVEYEQFYNHVYDALNEGRCVGIFPEGGSHDNPGHLPFKAGICIMALGAMEKYGIQVTLVPAGFNYYNPQNFRSKAFLEFGVPFKVPKELSTLYKTDKKKAVQTLLQELQKRLKQVTTQALTFQQLSTLFFCRALYTHMVRKKLTSQQKLQLNRRFVKGFNILLKQQKFREFYEQLKQFRLFTTLNGFSLITRESRNIWNDIYRFVIHIIKCLLRFVIGLPGLILMGPVAKLITYQVQKERQKCLKNSSVKISASDVVGSYKILLASLYFPIATIIYTVIFFYLLDHFTDFQFSSCKKLCLILPIFMPIYAFIEVKTYDSFSRHWIKLKYLFIRLFRRDIYSQYEERKKQISQKIINFIDEFGEEVVPNFKNHRIIKPEQIQSIQTNNTTKIQKKTS